MPTRKPPARPWSKTKATARILTPDEAWAEDVRTRILADCHPPQYDGALDPATRISFLVGRGGTKTTTMRVRGVLKTTSIRRGLIVYLATSRAQAEELMWFRLKDMVEAYGLTEEMSFLDGKLRMTCHRTGATYRLFGIEDKRDAEKLRGQPFDEVQLDEAGSWDPSLLEHTIDRCIAPRIGERKGAILIGGTPPPYQRGPFYDATRHGAVDVDGKPLHRPYKDRTRPEFANWLRWSSHSWTLKDVVELPHAAELYPALVANWEEALREKERKGYGDDHPVWMREFLGQWASDHTDRVFQYRPHVDGKEWNQWDPFGGRALEGLSALRAAIAALPKDVGTWHYVVTMDSGSRDPFACNAYAFAPADALRRILHVFAFEKTGMYPKLEAELLLGPALNTTKPDGIFGVIGWPDAVEIDADQAHIDELANVYGVRAKKAERKADYKYGAIEIVNGDFIEGRIKVIKGSPLEIQLQLLQWKPDEYGMLREDKAQANHSTDTLVLARLAIAQLFESGSVSEAPQRPVYVDPMGLDNHRDDGGSDLESLLAEPDYDDSWGAL